MPSSSVSSRASTGELTLGSATPASLRFPEAKRQNRRQDAVSRTGDNGVVTHGDRIGSRDGRGSGDTVHPDVLVAIVSVGATRTLAPRTETECRTLRYPVVYGDLSVMGGTRRESYEAVIIRPALVVGPKISVQFLFGAALGSQTGTEPVTTASMPSDGTWMPHQRPAGPYFLALNCSMIDWATSCMVSRRSMEAF